MSIHLFFRWLQSHGAYAPAGAPSGDALLLTGGEYLLLTDGSKILLS